MNEFKEQYSDIEGINRRRIQEVVLRDSANLVKYEELPEPEHTGKKEKMDHMIFDFSSGELEVTIKHPSEN